MWKKELNFLKASICKIEQKYWRKERERARDVPGCTGQMRDQPV
jgi:hypothetical protein